MPFEMINGTQKKRLRIWVRYQVLLCDLSDRDIRSLKRDREEQERSSKDVLQNISNGIHQIIENQQTSKTLRVSAQTELQDVKKQVCTTVLAELTDSRSMRYWLLHVKFGTEKFSGRSQTLYWRTHPTLITATSIKQYLFCPELVW